MYWLALTRDNSCSCNGWVRHPLSEWGEIAENGDQLDRVGGAVGTGAMEFGPVVVESRHLVAHNLAHAIDLVERGVVLGHNARLDDVLFVDASVGGGSNSELPQAGFPESGEVLT